MTKVFHTLRAALVAALLLIPAMAMAQDVPAPAPEIESPAEPESLGQTISKAIADAGEDVSAVLTKELRLLEGEATGLAFKLGAVFAIAVAIALFLGMIIGSALSAFILRRTLRRVSGISEAGGR